MKPGIVLLEKHEQIKEELAQLRIKYADLQKKYEHAKQIIQTMTQMELEFTEFPKQFEGFTLRRDEKGYIRAYKRNGNKTMSFYIGKKFSERKAKIKLRKCLNK